MVYIILLVTILLIYSIPKAKQKLIRLCALGGTGLAFILSLFALDVFSFTFTSSNFEIFFVILTTFIGVFMVALRHDKELELKESLLTILVLQFILVLIFSHLYSVGLIVIDLLKFFIRRRWW